MKWYTFNAYLNNEEVLERIPADNMDDAALELTRMGYKYITFEKSIDDNNVITDFIIGEIYTY